MKILMSLIFLFSLNLFATEKTTVKTSDLKKNSKKTAKDIDTEITDSKMRADSGSKSKFSGTVKFTYNGASWEKPLSNDRPNVDGGDAEPVQLSGGLGVRYRINKNDSIYVSTGIAKDRPFDGRSEDKWEVKNPTLMYGSWFRYKDTQVMTSIMTYYYTENRLQDDLNYVATLSGTIGTLNKIGSTNFNFGLTAYLSNTFFDNDKGVLRNPKTGQIFYSGNVEAFQMENYIDLRPMLQYKFSQFLNVYTSVGLATFYRTRASDSWDFEKFDITQTLGAGIAITRDFYLAPNIDFKPEDIRADDTSVNLSAIINVL